GQALDVKTLPDAANASNVLTTALDAVPSLRATVGALEERFTFASNAAQSAAQNQGAAKSNLLDTDVASTSTAFATAQVQLQAGIAVLAQANQLQQNLLKLIQ
ncbi:MAG: flagellin, partial [Pseudomonadota bacterium]